MADIITTIMGFDRKMTAGEAPFDTLPSRRVELGAGGSSYAPSTGTKSTAATLSKTLIKMCYRIFEMEKGAKDKGAIGRVALKNVAEYVSSRGDDTIDIAVYNPDEGTVQAIIFDTLTSTGKTYTLKKEAKDGTVVLMAMFPEFSTDAEFNEYFNLFKAEYDKGFPNLDEACRIAGVLSQNVYYRLKDTSCSANIPFSVPGTGNIQLIKNTALTAGIYNPDTVVYGEFQILDSKSAAATSPAAKAKKKKKGYEISDLVGKFNFNPSRVLSAEERAMVPKLEPWYIIPEFVMDVCETVKASVNTSYPMTNFTVRGGAGSGKSKATEAIAAGFDRPHVFYTCSADTEIFDFIGQVMPASKDSKDPEVMKLLAKFDKLGGINSHNIAKVYELPSLEDVKFMPDMVYEELTGRELPETMSEVDKIAETYKEWHRVMEEKFDEVMSVLSTDKDNKFVYTETNFIKAIKNGWVVEVQEPNVIASPGVLVGLNGLLEEGSISLPTGEVITRHPDTVVIFTTNVSYQGCRTMNQSVIDRSNELYDVDTPDNQAMVERVMAITEYPDEDVISEMASIVKDISNSMIDMGIDDGTCGMRSLISWAMKAKITGDPYKAAKTTVLAKCSNDKEAREALQKRLDESSFRASKRTRTR